MKGGETTGDRSEARTGARTGGAVQGEEVDEREQRGADDERRHGRRQRATAALAGRRHRQQRRRRLLLVLVPLHAARGRASAATCSAPEPEAGKSVVGLVRLVKCSCFPHSAARNKLTFLGPRAVKPALSRTTGTNQSAAPRRAATLHTRQRWRGEESGDWRGRKEEAAGRSRGEERHQWMEPAGRPSRARLCFCSFALDASLSPNLCRPFYIFVFFSNRREKNCIQRQLVKV